MSWGALTVGKILDTFTGGKTSRKEKLKDPLPNPSVALRSLRKVFHPDVFSLAVQKMPVEPGEEGMRKTVATIGDELIRMLNSVGDLMENDKQLSGDWDKGSSSLKEKRVFFLRPENGTIVLSSQQIRIGTPMDFLRHLHAFVANGTEPAEHDFTKTTIDPSVFESSEGVSPFTSMYGVMAEIQEWQEGRRKFETKENYDDLLKWVALFKDNFGIEVELAPRYVSTLDETRFLIEIAKIIGGLDRSQKGFWRGTRIVFDSHDHAPPGVMKTGDAEAANILIDNPRYFEVMKGWIGMGTDGVNVMTLRDAVANVGSADIKTLPERQDFTELWWIQALGKQVQKYGIRFTCDIDEAFMSEAEKKDKYALQNLRRDLRHLTHHLNHLVHVIIGDRDQLKKAQGSGITISSHYEETRNREMIWMYLTSPEGEKYEFKGHFHPLERGSKYAGEPLSKK